MRSIRALFLYFCVAGRELATDRFGGEYDSLRWFCGYLLADEAEARALLADDDARRFVDFFGASDWAAMREYLRARYETAETNSGRLLFLDELLRFNSPARPGWEHTAQVQEMVALEPGMRVADIGSGPGFFAFRFARQVGPAGTVFAVETNEDHVAYLRDIVEREGIANLEVMTSEGAFPDLPAASLDRLFLCSTYAPIVVHMDAEGRKAWLTAARAALKPDGRMVVSENESVLPPGVVAYRGLAVSRSVVQGQLSATGFELLDARSFVPQRYVLTFRAAAPRGPGG